MNEILIAILIPIILTGIAYGIAEFLMKLLKINHPKNMFFVYLIIFLITLCLVPFTALSLSESNSNDLLSTSTSSLSEISDVSESDMANISSVPFSSKIIPLYNRDNDQLNNGYPNSRFILEISWYDIIDEEDNIDSQTKQTSPNQSVENKDNLSSFAAFKEKFESFPPTLMFNFLLFSVALLFVIYQLFVAKIRYLKKIQAKPAKRADLLSLISQLSDELNIQMPKVYLFAGSPNAFVMGCPSILVISDKLIEVLSKNELKTTLRHELTHIKQHDILLKSFIQAIRIICFYNPFIHVIAKKLFNKRELLADAEYNTDHKDKISFMEALIKIAEYAQKVSSAESGVNPAISVSLIELSSANPTITERFISLFKQCKKKTLLTFFVSCLIIFTNTSAVLYTQSSFQQSIEPKTSSDTLVNVEQQYLVEDITYTTVYQKDNESVRDKRIMVHRTLYNVISIPSFMNQSHIREIVNYIFLSYYQSQQKSSAF